MRLTRTGHNAVDSVLETHIDGLETALGDELVAVYLHGSLAHGGFGEHSDIDFLAVVRAEPSDECLEALRTHHRQLHDAEPPWSHRLEGSYAPIDEFAGPPAGDGGWWYIDNGTDELARSRHDDTWVVRTTLVDDPVTLLGPEPSTIIGTIDRDALRDEIWSHFDTPTTLAILNDVGFEIVEIRQVPEMLDDRAFTHPFVVAKRS